MTDSSKSGHLRRRGVRTSPRAGPGSRSSWGPLGATLLLFVILLVAAYLRFTGLNWDEGQWIHPDEGHMRIITSVIEMPDRLSLYFDTHASPLNCRNRGHQYSYGTLPLFLTRMTAEWLDGACQAEPGDGALAVKALGLPCEGGSFTGTRSAVVGRALSALADVGTVFLLYLMGRRLYGETVGLLAAGLGALSAFSIQQAHFFTVDSMACFFVTLTAYFSVGAGQSGRWIDFGLAGLSTGLAAACKVDSVLVSLLVALAGGWWYLNRAHSSLKAGRLLLSVLLRLTLAGLLSLVAFRVAQPYAFEGPGFFGLRPSPEWFGRLRQIRVEQSGAADLPSGRQWTDRAPILFPWVNMVVWGMGLPLGLAAWVGWALVGFELWCPASLWKGKRGGSFRWRSDSSKKAPFRWRSDSSKKAPFRWREKHVHMVLWIWGTLMFLYQATRWVKSMRYSLSLYPIFITFAAYALIRLSRVSLGNSGNGVGNSAVRRLGRWLGLGLSLSVVVGAALWATAVFSIYLRPHTRLAASRWIYEHVPEGSTVANEHWDWGLPLRVDGRDPFGGMYNGLEMENYNEDTLEKRTRLFGWLDQADYIFLASNRLYASISRLPARYPLTTAYYRALFAGELGFELAADFTSRPAIGPFQFPDQECPYPLMEAQYQAQSETQAGPFDPILVHLPPAEEAFSVYDHPRVLIFRKTDDYSRQRVEQVLGDIDVTRALHGFSPREATAAPNFLEFDPQTWAEQQAGGTWSEMFNRHSLLNRYPGLAAVAWWVVVAGLGWLAFPLLFVALPRLRDRGYGFARTLALLLVAYLTWLAASLRVLPNTRWTILRMTVLLALVGGGVGWFNRRALRRFLRRRWRLILLTEGLFAGLYVLWIGVRLLHPDLWHPVVGGEKPMVFAYLGAVMKSTWFPPYNPWFSGAMINYYYFGFVIIGTLIKLMGTVPAVAYNLAVPLLAALTGVGAFSVAYNLFGGHRRGARLAGVTALAFTVLMGNLGVVQLIRAKLISLGGELFPSTIPGFPETVAVFRGLWQVIVRGARLPMRIESWYWHPTRIIPAGPGEVGPIAEFPAFTFLYGDLHAHMIAFPLVLLTLALAVHWASTPRPRWPGLLLGGLVIGALYPTNTWNFHASLILVLVALAVGTWRTRRRRAADLRADAWAFLWRALLLFGLTRLLYLPYLRHYAAGYTSLGLWRGSRTPFTIYLWIHGILLFPVVTRLLIEVGRVQARRESVPHARTAFLVWLVGLLAVTAVLVFIGHGVALVVVPVALLALYLLLVPGMPANRCLLWLMVGQAMAIGLGVEILVLEGDVGRMNTVFKFYLQAWMLLSIAAGVSLAWVNEHARRVASSPRQLGGLLVGRNLWWAVMAVLIFGGALFLPYGVRARAVDRMAPQVGLTLDGMAFMEHAAVFDGDPARESREIPLGGDYAAVRWMQDNVEGSPVILEGLGHREYLWSNRVSVYTGLPAVIGWRWHQVQQRQGVLPASTVDWRRSDVNECYNTPDSARAWEILDRYGVGYVYVGAYERAYYDPAGLAKFDAMVTQGLLRVVYDAQGVKIYQVEGG